jgi:hypothetical protein
VRVIERSLKQVGIKLITKTARQGYETQGKSCSCKVDSRQGDTIECDQILCTSAASRTARASGSRRSA